jgi:putative acetyltransferase
VTFSDARPDDPDILRLLRAHGAELAVRYGDEPEQDGGSLAPVPRQTVAVVAARRGDAVVACGALAAMEPGAGEIKRVYVMPEHRGVGIGRSLVEELERRAPDHGFELLRLETGTMQPEAVALYRSMGYETIPSYGDYKDSPLSICLARSLASTSSTTSAGERPSTSTTTSASDS